MSTQAAALEAKAVQHVKTAPLVNTVHSRVAHAAFVPQPKKPNQKQKSIKKAPQLRGFTSEGPGVRP